MSKHSIRKMLLACITAVTSFTADYDRQAQAASATSRPSKTVSTPKNYDPKRDERAEKLRDWACGIYPTICYRTVLIPSEDKGNKEHVANRETAHIGDDATREEIRKIVSKNHGLPDSVASMSYLKLTNGTPLAILHLPSDGVQVLTPPMFNDADQKYLVEIARLHELTHAMSFFVGHAAGYPEGLMEAYLPKEDQQALSDTNNHVALSKLGMMEEALANTASIILFIKAHIKEFETGELDSLLSRYTNNSKLLIMDRDPAYALMGDGTEAAIKWCKDNKAELEKMTSPQIFTRSVLTVKYFDVPSNNTGIDVIERGIFTDGLLPFLAKSNEVENFSDMFATEDLISLLQKIMKQNEDPWLTARLENAVNALRDPENPQRCLAAGKHIKLNDGLIVSTTGGKIMPTVPCEKTTNNSGLGINRRTFTP